MARKPNKGTVVSRKASQVQLHVWIPKDLKGMLIEMHQEFVDVNKINVTFGAFVQHIIEEGIKAKDSDAK